MTNKPLAGIVCLFGLIVPGWALAQDASPELLERQTQAQPEQRVTLPAMLTKADQIDDPARRLGVRASLLRQVQQVIPTVVIVEDAGSFAEAIAGWHGPIRYPVLWDDGTPVAREHIARFVRAFEPERVVRWRAPADSEPWPKESDARIERIRAAQAAALGLRLQTPGYHEIVQGMIDYGITPHGIIISDAADPAWVAALALGAGRIEPIYFVKTPGKLVHVMSVGQAEAFDRAIHVPLKGMKLAWDALGDDIDAITLAMNAPNRVKVADVDPQKPNQQDIRALTDLIGRHGTVGAGARWAWCGQIIGNEAQAAYQAACSLFLETDSAWVFDGYATGKPWDTFDGTAAAEALRSVGWRCTVYDYPRAGLDQWRLASAGTVDAGLLMVNTHGQYDDFNLTPGRGSSGDMPVLQRPALVHFVHSFSAQRPGVLKTIGGRLLLNGAYGYLGSVHEPFLDAFVPPPMVAKRLLAGYPWGAAVRTDHRGWWRLTVIGDPLITVGSGGVRLDDARVTLAGGRDLDEARIRALKERDYAGGIEALALLGRDADAARLAMALLDREPESFTPAVAAVSIMPLMRTRKHRGVVDAFARLDADDQKELIYLDALWHAARLELLDRGSVDVLARLRNHLRPGQEGDDALELAKHMARHLSPGSAVAFLRDVRNKVTLDARKTRLVNQAIEGYLGARP